MTKKNAATEIIATRHTSDGIRVHLTSDGWVTMPFRGSRLLGSSAGFALMSEIELYNRDEFLRAAEVMRRAFTQTHVEPLSYFRRVMAGKRMVCHCNAMGSVGAVSFR